MGNEMKNVARGFKFLWATFSKTMGNVFSRHGQCFLLLSVDCASCPWVIRWLRLLSVGCAYRLYPRLCAGHRAAVRIRVYQEYALVSLRASTRNLILALSNATCPRPYQLHGMWCYHC